MTIGAAQPGSSARPPVRIIALTGFMGCGKSTVGRALASLLGWEFADLDEHIERQEGMAVREIFAQRGEPHFRNLEHLALQEVLGTVSLPTVIALGGGTFVSVRNKRLLHDAGAFSVFLELPLGELVRRCESCADGEPSNPRPLAQNTEEFQRLYEERLPWYRCANTTINGTGKTAVEVAQEIAARLQFFRRTTLEPPSR
jgi:shikimate kinase